jgi:hypothetical protein
VDRNHDTGDGQARSLSNLQIITRHLDPDFQLLKHDLTRGETGLLRVFSLISRTAGNPSFEARVDDGSPGNRTMPKLDIDINGVSRSIARRFKSGRDIHYYGHHADRSPNANQRIFEVEIGAGPLGRILSGEVSFNVAFSVGAYSTETSNVTVSAALAQETFYAKLRNFLNALY